VHQQDLLAVAVLVLVVVVVVVVLVVLVPVLVLALALALVPGQVYVLFQTVLRHLNPTVLQVQVLELEEVHFPEYEVLLQYPWYLLERYLLCY
jgi:hypothetical protein